MGFPHISNGEVIYIVYTFTDHEHVTFRRPYHGHIAHSQSIKVVHRFLYG